MKTFFKERFLGKNYEADIKQRIRAKTTRLNLVFASRNEKHSFPSKERGVRVISAQILERED